MASTFTTVQFMDPPGGPGVTGAVKAGPGIIISADGTISTTSGGGIVKTVTGTNGISTAGTTDVIVTLNAPTATTIGGVRTVEGSGIAIDSAGIIRSVAQYSIQPGTGISVTNVTPISSTVSVTAAGRGAANRGGVWLDDNSGLSVTSSGALSVTPATTVVLGGVKVGNGLAITSDGTLSTTGGIGTITNVVAGTGLTGGGSSGSVTLNLVPATTGFIGGVKQGAGVAIAPDGTISVTGTGTVTEVTGNAPISVANGTTTPAISVALASTTAPGVVQLIDATDSSSVSLAPTANALSTVQQLASAAIPSSLLTAQGSLIVGGLTGTPTQLLLGSPGQVLTVTAGNAGWSTLGLESVVAANGTATSAATFNGGLTVSGGTGFVANTLTYPIADGTPGQVLTTNGGGTLAFADIPPALGALPLTGGMMTGDITFNPGQLFPGVVSTSIFTTANSILVGTGAGTYGELLPASPGDILTYDGGNLTWVTNFGASALPLDGGTMSGDITFAGTQDFPGVVADTSFLNSGDLLVGTGSGTYTNLPQGTNGQVLTVSGGTVTWAAPALSNYLPLAGGTMTGTISFAAGQTISGYVANTLYSTTGDIAYASSGNTPARLGIGAAGTILAVNGGIPAWRTSTQLGLLTSATAAATYAPLNTPTFTGPVTVNAGGSPGTNSLTVSGGNLVLATQFTPSSSSDTGSVGELAWDNSGYLYFCYLPNTWGRVQIDLTPF